MSTLGLFVFIFLFIFLLILLSFFDEQTQSTRLEILKSSNHSKMTQNTVQFEDKSSVNAFSSKSIYLQQTVESPRMDVEN